MQIMDQGSSLNLGSYPQHILHISHS